MVLPLGDPPALVTLTWGRGCGLQLGILCAQRGGQAACVGRRAGGAGPKPCSAGEPLTRRGWGKCGQVAGRPLGQRILPWAQTARGREGPQRPGTLSGELLRVPRPPQPAGPHCHHGAQHPSSRSWHGDNFRTQGVGSSPTGLAGGPQRVSCHVQSTPAAQRREELGNRSWAGEGATAWQCMPALSALSPVGSMLLGQGGEPRAPQPHKRLVVPQSSAEGLWLVHP